MRRPGPAGASEGGPGSPVTWVVVLYSSNVLARLSARQVHWESPKPTEAGSSPTETLRLWVRAWGVWGGLGRVSLGAGRGPRDSTGLPDPPGSRS